MESQENLDDGPLEDETVEYQTPVQLLGVDPWVRFDTWAARAWESTEKAVATAMTNGDPHADTLDTRVLAAFHAAQIAKSFAEMVNPLFAAAHSSAPATVTPDAQVQAILAMMLEDEE